MSAIAYCSNKGFCALADQETKLDLDLGGCPRCSKELASPHRLTIELEDDDTGILRRVDVTLVRIAAPASIVSLRLKVDKTSHDYGAPLAPGKVATFPFAGLKQGHHHIEAVLRTSDQRMTSAETDWFEPDNSVSLSRVVGVLVLFALACACGVYYLKISEPTERSILALASFVLFGLQYALCRGLGSFAAPARIVTAVPAVLLWLAQAELFADTATPPLARGLAFAVFAAALAASGITFQRTVGRTELSSESGG